MVRKANKTVTQFPFIGNALQGQAMTYFKIAVTILGLTANQGCDPQGLKKCNWLLEPDESRANLATEEVVPACARNYKSEKQDCRLLVPRELAKKMEGKKFIYDDMKVKNSLIPRRVTSIEPCE